MTEFTQSIPLERSTLLPTCLVMLACLLVTLAILLTPARATRNLATSQVMPRKQQ